ncbi:hypothetical protein ACIHFD_10645 [Nonomuraea sp. NPDC051941]|uniref:hypothetical protein n=1 Tax=Nonomuraea sp. NPDC051941 TaxID=3364373 RepID=UPI0037CA4C93
MDLRGTVRLVREVPGLMALIDAYGLSLVSVQVGGLLWGVLSTGLIFGGLLVPYAEAAEQTILQKVVPYERQGRVFGFAQSVEQAASTLTAFLISPIAQFVFIPLMTDGGAGARTIGDWFGSDCGLALVFMLTGVIGLIATTLALRSHPYQRLSRRLDSGPATRAATAASLRP